MEAARTNSLLPAWLALALAAGCGADSPGGAVSACPYELVMTNHDGLLHGQPCTDGSQCLYGTCHVSPAVADFAFCTKRCDCGPNSACGDENGAGLEFVCQRFDAASASETLPAYCTQVCSTVADCPPQYDGCAVVTGSRKTCVRGAAAARPELLD